MERRCVYFFSVGAFVISAVALLFVKVEPLEVAWTNTLVAVLALITSVLIAWQIYKTIEIDRAIKRKVDKAKEEIEKATTQKIHLTIARISLRVANIAKENKNKDIMFLEYVEALSAFYSCAPTDPGVNVCFDVLDEIVNNNGDVRQIPSATNSNGSIEVRRTTLSALAVVNDSRKQPIIDYINRVYAEVGAPQTAP